MQITIEIEEDGAATFKGRYLVMTCPACNQNCLPRLCLACLESESGACSLHGHDLPEARERRARAEWGG